MNQGSIQRSITSFQETTKQEYKSGQAPIHTWAEEDRPREKMLQNGRKNLSNAELLAILLGSGSRQLSAVELAKLMLQQNGNNLQQLAEMSIQEMQRFKGIGPAKAITVAAALELGLRRQATPMLQRPQITNSEDAYRVLVADLMDLPHEEFILLVLNRSNHVLERVKISVGGLASTVVDVKKIYTAVLNNKRASALVLAHNHPSGNPNPSKEDIAITHKIKQAGSYLDIQVLDHIIVAGNTYASLADKGLM